MIPNGHDHVWTPLACFSCIEAWYGTFGEQASKFHRAHEEGNAKNFSPNI